MTGSNHRVVFVAAVARALAAGVWLRAAPTRTPSAVSVGPLTTVPTGGPGGGPEVTRDLAETEAETEACNRRSYASPYAPLCASP